ncbi:hypothetical protein H634G_10502 [Metarhizium anisopliae BRIP 53293]|uniref:Uncharacterized protein n=1 Tax=Metarhizium anisopliae BRIP 53293 TaxID=1291518 RepID=A0A0D9NJT7_METAN|nr:hypothetical protein H634G_10502 [Metarhizium anisopliae BRIP 53293]KJK87168.1 hypothetical protein H633G_08971 [Metarhizium anisopliae BRIP 53284]
MKFTPVIAAGLVAFATAQPARDARVARTPDTGFTVFADEGCAGFRGNPKCQEYAEKCYKDSKNLATKQQVIDCTQAKLKADALGPGGAPSKEQFCAGYMKDPKCQEYAKACEQEEFAKLRKAAESDSRDWNGDAEPARQLPTGQQLIYCTQAKLVGPSLLDKLCVRFGWENRQGCIAKITDCNTKGEVLADCMLPHDEYGIDFPDQD